MLACKHMRSHVYLLGNGCTHKMSPGMWIWKQVGSQLVDKSKYTWFLRVCLNRSLCTYFLPQFMSEQQAVRLFFFFFFFYCLYLWIAVCVFISLCCLCLWIAVCIHFPVLFMPLTRRMSVYFPALFVLLNLNCMLYTCCNHWIFTSQFRVLLSVRFFSPFFLLLFAGYCNINVPLFLCRCCPCGLSICYCKINVPLFLCVCCLCGLLLLLD